MSLTRLLGKNRKDEDKVLYAGTYGIGGARMLNRTFRHLTAEGGFDPAVIAKLRAHHALEA